MLEITAVNDHMVDIELVGQPDLGERLRSYENSQDHHGMKPLICRVPKIFHEIDGSAYVPHRWSIGPYHKGNKNLEEKQKLYFLVQICKHFPATTVEKYYDELQLTEVEARMYYSGDVPMNTPSFVEMLMLDSCFILGTLRILDIPDSINTGSNSIGNNAENRGAQNSSQSNPGFAGEENSEENNVQTTSRARSDEWNPQAQRDLVDFLHDLLLLENQIPFFIIQRMYNVASGNGTTNGHVTSQLADRLKEFIPEFSITTVKNNTPEIHHLLHFLHWLLAPPKEQNDCSQVGCSWLNKQIGPKECQSDKKEQQAQFMRWRRAVEYHEAGVHFKLPRQPSDSPLNIKFENGELRIPKLIIDEKTNFIFRNLLAFEQETAQFGYHITTYITFMSQLLSMPEDVTLLSRKGIIEHHLGCDEDVSELLKNLTKFRFVELGSRGYLKSVCYALEKHYKNHWNRWFAWLRHKHMTNPWLILGLFVAAIVAISAVVQAFCSVIPLVHRKHSKSS